MTRKDFAIIFGVMCDYFKDCPSDGVTDIYFEDLKHLSVEEFKAAFQTLRRDRVYPGLPKIAEIKEAIEGKAEDRIVIAYQTLMETLRSHSFWDSVIFEDGAIGNAVEDMGGWARVSDWTIEEWKFRRKEFEQLYQAHLRRGNTEPYHLVGYFEKDNSSKGLTNHIPKPIMISDKNRLAIENKSKKALIEHKEIP